MSAQITLTESETFSRSQKIPPTIDLLFQSLRIANVNLYITSSVAKFFLNPNCFSTNILLIFIISYHLFSLCGCVQDYKIHMDMEIVKFT